MAKWWVNKTASWQKAKWRKDIVTKLQGGKLKVEKNYSWIYKKFIKLHVYKMAYWINSELTTDITESRQNCTLAN